MPIRAISFDLFDTLVDLEMEKLPEFELAGQRRRGTLPALYAALPENLRGSIDFETFGHALDTVDARLRATREAAGRELPTRERFAALLAHLRAGPRQALDARSAQHPAVAPNQPGPPTPPSGPTSPLALSDDHAEALALELTAVHMGEIQSRARALDDTPGVLRTLHERFPLAVCSNFSHSPTALRVLSEAGLDFAFHATVISEDVGYRKPHPEIFTQTARALGLPPSDILHVGDNLTADIQGATTAGMQTAWITRRIPNRDTALTRHLASGGLRPDHTITHLHELLETFPASRP